MRGLRQPRKIDVIKAQSHVIEEQAKLIDYLMQVIIENVNRK